MRICVFIMALTINGLSFADGSKGERAKQTVTVASEPFGIAVWGSSGFWNYGGLAGLHLSDTYMLQFRQIVGGSCSGGKCRQNINIKYLNLRIFQGNSFYTDWGVSKFDSIFNPDDSTLEGVGGYNHSRYDRSMLAGYFGIGNQWSWPNFTIGCDWVGVTVPLQELSRSQTVSAEASDPSRDETDANRNAKSLALQAVRLYIGASF